MKRNRSFLASLIAISISILSAGLLFYGFDFIQNMILSYDIIWSSAFLFLLFSPLIYILVTQNEASN